jgi:hypothetical protein
MTTAQQAYVPERSYGPLVIALVIILLLGLPLAAWLDMSALSERILRRQSDDISRIIDDMRGFYANDVVGRVMAEHAAVPTHNYKEVKGGIPIPATLSIELGKRISTRNDAVGYRFVSDYPFKGREKHALDEFELNALAALREDPKKQIVDVSGSIFDRTIRLVSPVLLMRMRSARLAAGEAHPKSERRTTSSWLLSSLLSSPALRVPCRSPSAAPPPSLPTISSTGPGRFSE